MNWQPIDSAPQGGQKILAVCAGIDKRTGKPWVPCIVFFDEGRVYPDDPSEEWDLSFTLDEWLLTHWMPLPIAPEAK